MAASRDNEAIVAETDHDSAISVPLNDSLTSLRSSVLQHQIENGRTYHGMSSGKYAYPNDSSENERLEIQHNVWLLTLDGALALCPKGDQGAKRVLDLGTGTGCWAIDYADAHPESEVIGVDLSPIQPSLTPPNCAFEIDDVEKEWTWSESFDFIFSRVMAGSFADYQAYIDKAYSALEPGGWLEMQDIVLPFIAEDDTLDPDCELARIGHLFLETSSALGRPLDVPLKYKSMMEKAGFVGIVERHFKWPLNAWPRDAHYKEIGAWTLVNLDGGLEGLTLALFTRALNWSKEQTTVYCAVARKQLKDRRIHSILPTIVVYGQKPANPTAPAAESPPPVGGSPAAA